MEPVNWNDSRGHRHRNVVAAALGLLLCVGLLASCSTAVPASTLPARTELTYFRGDAYQPALKMELWVPNPAPVNKMKVLVILHGGGFWGGTRTSFGAPNNIVFGTKLGTWNLGNMSNTRWDDLRSGQAFMSKLADGWAIASIDYGLSTQVVQGTPTPSYTDGTGTPGTTTPPAPTTTLNPNTPQTTGHLTLEDEVVNAKRAINYLEDNADFLNLDGNNIVIGGTSAGGTLSTIVGLTPGRFEPHPSRTTRVKGVVNLDGPLDLRNFHDCAVDQTVANNSVCGPIVDPAHPDLVVPTSTATLDYDIEQRFGAEMEYKEYLPAASNCANGDLDTTNPSSNCGALVNAMINRLSPYALVTVQPQIAPTSVAPMFVMCTVNGTSFMPRELRCAYDQKRFHDQLVSRMGTDQRIVLNQSSTATHLTLESGLDYPALNNFLNQVTSS